jgi:hypothetical protein
VVSSWLGGSLVTGDAERMTSLQRGAVHYFQRPDATHVRVDSTASSLAGWAGRVIVNKQRGNVLVNGGLGVVNPGFELNDLGFQSRADLISSHVVAGYRWTEPTRTYQRLVINNALFSAWDFGGTRTATGVAQFGNVTWRNFYRSYWNVFYNSTATSVRRTRGGPAMTTPGGVDVGFGTSTDDRKRVQFGVNANASRYARGFDRSWGVDVFAAWKPTQRVALRFGPSYFRNGDGAQYVTAAADPLATATYGARYVFGELQQHTLAADLRLNWIFTPRLSVELFLQPLVSSGSYTQLKELAAPRSYDFVRYGVDGASTWDRRAGIVDPDGPGGPAAPITVGNPDFTFASLRGNAVLRWEYRPGSTLFVVWTRSSASELSRGSIDFGTDWQDLFRGPAENIFLVKFTYWVGL